MYTVITGASTGIGRATADYFAKKGHDIIIIARRAGLLEEVREAIMKTYGVSVISKPCDLSVLNEVYKLYESLKLYDINIWINNAGIGDYSYTWEADLDKLTTMIQVNIQALMVLSSLYVRDYIDREATLMNVSSGAGYFVFSKAVPYAATKFFVSSFTEGLAQNLIKEDKKMRVKILAPGGTDTEFVDQANGAFIGEDIFDMDSFLTAEALAVHVYELYESDSIIGMVSENNEFILRDPIFPYGG